MNWKTILLPRRLRSAYKRIVKLKARGRCLLASRILSLGYPRALANFLAARGLRGRVVLQKQGIRSIIAGDRFFRFALNERGAAKLRREVEGWREFRDAGFESILTDDLRVHELEGALLLESDLLQPISRAEQAEKTLPIIERLVAGARPGPAGAIPPTITASLGLAEEVCSPEEHRALLRRIEEAFASPLLTGLSHQDLHLRNVMQDEAGRPILIDLKSTARDQILALDLLVFACKFWLARDGHNVIDQAVSWHHRDWRIPEISPALDHIDLPRPVWALTFVLHALGRVLVKGGIEGRTRSLLGSRLKRVLGALRD